MASDGVEQTTSQRTIAVPIPDPNNAAPTAAFTATPPAADAPLDVAFDASASTDPDGTIASYAWGFGDGTSGTGKAASHTYAEGTHTATLKVTDDDGATATATLTIKAMRPNRPPVPFDDVLNVQGAGVLDVLANDFDPDGERSRRGDPPAHGTATAPARLLLLHG